MKDQEFPSQLNIPSWQWWFEKWTTVVSLFLGVFIPLILDTKYSLTILVAIIVTSIILGFLIPAPFVWLWKAVKIILQRINLYPKIYGFAVRKLGELDTANKVISDLIQVLLETSILKFEIIKAVRDEKKIFFVLARKHGTRLAVGDKLRIVDKDDMRHMAECSVFYARDDGYYIAGDIDPLWKGFILSSSSLDIPVTPNKIALLIARSGDDEKTNNR